MNNKWKEYDIFAISTPSNDEKVSVKKGHEKIILMRDHNATREPKSIYWNISSYVETNVNDNEEIIEQYQ